MAAKIHTTKDAPFAPLKKKTLAVIGFGSQGHAHALNLKDCGLKVIIGLYPLSKSREIAVAHGFEVMDTAAAVKAAEVIFIAVPDAVIPAVYEKDIAPHLAKGKTLLFAHGFAVHFKTVKPARNVDVILVAPRGPGHAVRSLFVAGMGVPGLIAVHRDVTGRARPTALAWAGALGCARAGIYETSFREETITRLFGEQCVTCGGVSALVKAGFETLVDAGYAPVMAYYGCLHELKLIADLMSEQGLAGMRFSISDTAEYGDLTVGPRIIDAAVRKRLAAQLQAIESGKFAKEWMHEFHSGGKTLKAARKAENNHPIEKIGDKLRATMSWIRQGRLSKGASQAGYPPR
jgi:ketol-acid reductoisomerase